jgi:hypothetical protein
MSKLKARNTALASHLAGSRGAGRHASAERKYAKGKSDHLEDGDAATPDDLGDAITALVAERSALGLGNSRLSDLLVLGSAADVKRQLDALVAAGRLSASDLLACSACGKNLEVVPSSKKRPCCNNSLLRKIGESFSA